MASPHTAGLLAYLLSIYPSATFDPATGSLVPPALSNSPIASLSFADSYALAYEYLPGWLTQVLPEPSLLGHKESVAPIPATLTPAQLKKALVLLSTPDKISVSDLPSGSPNRIIFNNATDDEGRNWVVDELFPTL